MKLKTKYTVFVIIIHLVCLVMSYFIFLQQNLLFFMLAEIMIIISVLMSIRLYRQLIKPLVYLKQGVNAIKDHDFNVKFLPAGKSEIDELVDVYNRMIDELRAERTKQQEQHFFLEKLIQTSPTGIIILDYDGEVKQVNPKATEVLKLNPDLLLRELHSVKAGASKIVRIGSLHTYKIQKSRFIDRGFERIFIMIEEVTAEIFEAEKNVYNKIIRMMAHEVNNTIGPVNSIIGMAMAQKDSWHNELKNALQVAIDRNQNLNMFMRNFADLVKLPPANLKKTDLVALLRDVLTFMQFRASEKQIDLYFAISNEAFFIYADAQQMEQVLINIVKNAIEAIGNAGTISFTLDRTKKQLVIADNGSGIAKNNAAQLFSPFFSTKKDGQGIGLTLVREILLNHNFGFSLATVAKNQTLFCINFS